MQKNTPIFDNTEIAFALKSDSELERAYFLFKMISIEPLVRIGTAATNFALKAHLPIEGLIRSTVFDHFCGGVNEEDCLPVINKMYEKGVSSVLDFSVEAKESEKEFDYARDVTLKIIEFCKEIKAIPIAVFKPSGFGRFYLYEKISKGDALTTKEQEEWRKVVERFDVVCKKAKANNVAVLIDAEESWIQDAVDALITQMMAKYNTEKPIVFNTLQMYRHDRLAFLRSEHEKATIGHYFLGYKLVRGAYMEKENDRAEEMGYESPICKSKAATDDNFNAGLSYVLDHIDCMSLFAGTHNEVSSYLLMDLMAEKGIENNDPRVWFGQLYGMSDHISFNLADKGYNVAKYVPFGPVKDVMPYLIRRAEENTSVAGQTGRELALLAKEKKRRRIS
ncbi:bifunctional proline dehydrogenase/pyrroline-5-carboxylate dehydrogenase [Mariniflexile rhizosphaerae]|uniref:proline dehydrogenase family protein n=1 Tax=unclassified Mariniflexile TaxID=2643887 RepID=UPI000CC253ED|nr:proline dehydrogenase family protein [Mariniflexile sp. TRM1-10]AXP82480.1 bifunctional proline dehydrogenase/pyrroline-5-carboxylate dehydrogenase [Mariniflexile sp. TRM1-10]PLB17808.1 MAG: Proline dehydrogenase [Flavobacteriaceae bacterium FS1-H7996/R]